MIGASVIHGVSVAAALGPERIAIIDGNRTLSFGALAERANRVANGVTSGLGLAAGARVAILAPNCMEYVELTLGLAAARTPAVFLNSRLSSVELGQICEDCDARALFVHPRLRGLVEDLGSPPGFRIIELGDGYEDWLARASSRPLAEPGEGEDIFCVAPTGGTTGRSKGVLLNHRSRVLMFLAMGSVFGCYSTHDRNLTVSPLFHGAGFNFCFATLFFGGTVVLETKFDPDVVLHRLAAERITNASVVPTHLAALFNLGEGRMRACDTSALKALISNGAPLSASMKALGSELWREKVLFEAYGGTEAGVISVMSPGTLLQRPASVGEIFPGTFIELRDDAGEPVAPGEPGELCTRSPYLFSGYAGAAPGAGLVDGWFSAGDIGRLDKDGYLYLLDRRDEKIISGGVNIYPSEVELAIADHPAVADVAVFGVADAYWGETVHAMVSFSPGASTTTEELLAFAEVRLGRLKSPKSLEIRPSLPKSAAGKVLRRVLRDEHRAAALNAREAAASPQIHARGGKNVH